MKSLSYCLELSFKARFSFIVFLSTHVVKAIHQFCCLMLHIFQNSYIFFHMWCPYYLYSRCGLTKVKKNFINRGPSRYEKILRINSIIVFAFSTFTEICSSNFSSASRITSRSFNSKTCSSSCRWRVYFSVQVML